MVFILPCAHELNKFKEKGDCDEKVSAIPRENTSSCSHGKKQTYKGKDCQDDNVLKNTWNLFEGLFIKDEAKTCKSTNMIGQLLVNTMFKQKQLETYINNPK